MLNKSAFTLQIKRWHHFCALILFPTRTVKGGSSVLWDLLSARVQKLGRQRCRSFCLTPLCEIHSAAANARSCSFCGSTSFLAFCSHLPVWDDFYPLFQALGPQVLWEHGKPGVAGAGQRCPARSPEPVPERCRFQPNRPVASSISSRSPVSLTPVGAGSHLNWISGRWIGIGSSCGS